MKKTKYILICMASMIIILMSVSYLVNKSKPEEPDYCPNSGFPDTYENIYECFEVDIEKIGEKIEDIEISVRTPGLYQRADGIYGIYSWPYKESKNFLGRKQTLLNIEEYYKVMSENKENLEIGDWLYFESSFGQVRSYLLEKDGKYYNVEYQLTDKRAFDEEYKSDHTGKDMQSEYYIDFMFDFLTDKDKIKVEKEILNEVKEREARIKEYINSLNIDWVEDMDASMGQYKFETVINSQKPNVHYSVPITIEYDGKIMLNVRK